MLQLGIAGFSYADLYEPTRLRELHDLFFIGVEEKDADLHNRWKEYAETKGKNLNSIQISDLLVQLAPHVGEFVARLFKVEAIRNEQKLIAERDQIVFEFKREFLTLRALKKFPDLASISAIAPKEEILEFVDQVIAGPFGELTHGIDKELAIARICVQVLNAEKEIMANKPDAPEKVSSIRTALQHLPSSNLKDSLYSADIAGAASPDIAFMNRLADILKAWAALHVYDPELKERVLEWASYHLPKKFDFEHLVHIIRPEELIPEKFLGPEAHYRRRDGFKLTDHRMSRREIQGETDYCIFCHERDKDSCSKGMHEKNGDLKKNPLGISLTGCPLDEKIGEMHVMRNHGDSIAALSLIMVDNPMCPGTGHRICNDCMKGCIYQKQTPVNIPQAETGSLTDVLKLPYGFEIYGFLTRWNPLNINRPYALPYNGRNVLVVGLGPAGYTLAHYLSKEGFGVVGIDGLKIEPLEKELTGYITPEGKWVAPKPVEDWQGLCKPLDERSLDGFGGVAEYGITVRWDKNFLTTIYLTLARRANFAIYGGVRFGGTITIEEAFEHYNFDHIAIASGAGKPTVVPMKNNLLRGIRKASDFLMSLQLTGAAKRDTMTNLEVQLPAVVIGGGLTAIDTATELMAYYPVQVEKIYTRYTELAAVLGEERVTSLLNTEEKQKLETFLVHGKAIVEERARAKAAGEMPNFIPFLRAWGGVSIVYRKRLNDSPAYRLNHEEVEESLEEGIYYYENLSPKEALANEYGAVRAIVFDRQKEIDGKWRSSGEDVVVEAKSVCVAAGTSPNTIYEKERPGTFQLDRWKDFFQSFNLESEDELTEQPEPEHSAEDLNLITAETRLALKEKDYESGALGFFTSYDKDGKYITYYGDNHPIYAGNVVKAMASAKNGYPQVVKAVFGTSLERPVAPFEVWAQFRAKMDDEFLATVVRVERLTHTIVEVVVHAPAAARHFEPGQFYRLQNFEKLARRIHDTTLTMEGLALTGAWVDKAKGLLSLIVLEMGSSSRLCAALKPGEPVIVMGPTGAPTEIPENQTVLLAGGGLGNAVLFSIAKALKEKNNNVIYFAGYKHGEDLFKREDIEASTDQVIWSTDSGEFIAPDRPQDAHFRGNIIEAMLAYQQGKLEVAKLFPFEQVDRIIAIGSDRMMAAVKVARRPGGVLYEYFKEEHVAIGSINSPMQCMMKEICAQCLQKSLDAATQEEKGFVFTCFNQDQHLDEVDFQHLNERLRTNNLEEKLSILWLEYLLDKEHVEMV